jgi:uncharacterized protein YdeI (YjbR/CyaY-like superfamily)
VPPRNCRSSRSRPAPSGTRGSRELKRNKRAREFFATLDSRNRYAILYRLQDAKKPETRARRLEQFVAKLTAHEKIVS